MFETETFGPCLVRKLKWGAHGPSDPPPVATSMIYAELAGNVKTRLDASDNEVNRPPHIEKKK